MGGAHIPLVAIPAPLVLAARVRHGRALCARPLEVTGLEHLDPDRSTPVRRQPHLPRRHRCPALDGRCPAPRTAGRGGCRRLLLRDRSAGDRVDRARRGAAVPQEGQRRARTGPPRARARATACCSSRRGRATAGGSSRASGCSGSRGTRSCRSAWLAAAVCSRRGGAGPNGRQSRSVSVRWSPVRRSHRAPAGARTPRYRRTAVRRSRSRPEGTHHRVPSSDRAVMGPRRARRRSIRSVRRYSLSWSRTRRLRIRFRPGVRIPPSALHENGPLRTSSVVSRK
jgi:hypothetical protein